MPKEDRKEYIRILDEHNAGTKGLTRSQCLIILMEHGATYQQANNDAYIYLFHRNHIEVSRKGSKEEYDKLLDDFDAGRKQPKECIKYLESIDFSYGQAKSAVNRYREERGLIRR